MDAFVYRNDVRSVKVIETFLKSENAPLVEAAARALVQTDVMAPGAGRSMEPCGGRNKSCVGTCDFDTEIDAEDCELIDSIANSGIASAAFSALLNLDSEAAEGFCVCLWTNQRVHCEANLRIAFRREDLQILISGATVSVPDQLLPSMQSLNCLCLAMKERYWHTFRYGYRGGRQSLGHFGADWRTGGSSHSRIDSPVVQTRLLNEHSPCSTCRLSLSVYLQY